MNFRQIKMIKFPIALQLYTVREDMKNDFEGTLKKVKEMGYDGVEFAGLFGNTPEQVRQDLEGMQTMRTLARNMSFLMILIC